MLTFKVITHQELHTQMLYLYMDILHIKILDRLYIDLSVDILNFLTSPKSNYLVNAITPEELPTVSRKVLHKQI